MPILNDALFVTPETMENIYNVFRALFFPPPLKFTQPMLDSFASTHDQLFEDATLFTTPARLGEIGVDIDWVVRELQRQEESISLEKSGDSHLALDDVRKIRLRSKLKTHAGQGDISDSRETIIARSKQRIERFNEDMTELEVTALNKFKEGLRNAVAK